MDQISFRNPINPKIDRISERPSLPKWITNQYKLGKMIILSRTSKFKLRLIKLYHKYQIFHNLSKYYFISFQERF